MAIPSRVERIDGLAAVVEAAGKRRTVNLMLLEGTVQVGDYVLVQNGQFASERMDAAQAHAVLALIDELVAGNGGADVRIWG